MAAAAHRLAPLSLGVYLIRPLWIAALGRVGVDGFFISPAIGIALTTAVVVGPSLLSARAPAALPMRRRSIQ